MQRGRAVRRHDAVLAAVVGCELVLKLLNVVVVVPAVSHAVLDHAHFVVGDPGTSHVNRFHQVPFLMFKGLAGTPITVVAAGTSALTKAPAPTIASAWI